MNSVAGDQEHLEEEKQGSKPPAKKPKPNLHIDPSRRPDFDMNKEAKTPLHPLAYKDLLDHSQASGYGQAQNE